MRYFEELSLEEVQENINGGGVLSCVAGGLAGAIIGAYVGLIPSVVTGDASYIKQSVVTGATAGVWVGAGCPLP